MKLQLIQSLDTLPNVHQNTNIIFFQVKADDKIQQFANVSRKLIINLEPLLIWLCINQKRNSVLLIQLKNNFARSSFWKIFS